MRRKTNSFQLLSQLSPITIQGGRSIKATILTSLLVNTGRGGENSLPATGAGLQTDTAAIHESLVCVTSLLARLDSLYHPHFLPHPPFTQLLPWSGGFKVGSISSNTSLAHWSQRRRTRRPGPGLCVLEQPDRQYHPGTTSSGCKHAVAKSRIAS